MATPLRNRPPPYASRKRCAGACAYRDLWVFVFGVEVGEPCYYMPVRIDDKPRGDVDYLLWSRTGHAYANILLFAYLIDELVKVDRVND